MPSWEPSQYLQFKNERTLPCRDLARRLDIEAPSRLIDLGCGPGNSTDVLIERWPDAQIMAIDSSADMIASARQSHALPSHRKIQWKVEDISIWAETNGGAFDLVFSNAAMQWVGNHAQAFPRLLSHVAPGGALAVQMPGNFDSPAHLMMRELAASAGWRDRFPKAGVREWHIHDLPFYYDVLAPHARRIDLWTTEYFHIMPDVSALAEWYKGTGLRPFLDALQTDGDREQFVQQYTQSLEPKYPRRGDGKILFPFRRLFIVAYR